jgi:hypothetical protein
MLPGTGLSYRPWDDGHSILGVSFSIMNWLAYLYAQGMVMSRLGTVQLTAHQSQKECSDTSKTLKEKKNEKTQDEKAERPQMQC